MAESIGMVLARIHHLRLTDGRSLAAILTVHGERHWRVLAERTARAGIPWAQRLHAALPHVAELEGRVVAARSDPDPVLLTHRDADPTNTLVTPAGDLLLVDWDTASACSPRHEIAAATLDWSRACRARTAIMRAVVCGYRRAGGDFERPEPSVFAGFCCGILNWLEYNVRRGLGERLLDPEDREIAQREVLLLLDALPRIAGSLERWARLLA
jgi:hypothetical protein